MLASCQNDYDNGGKPADIVNVGDRIPQFLLKDTDGDVVSSEELKGQVFVLSFFDTGCGDCRKELPVLQRIYDKYEDVVPIFNVPRIQSSEEV